MSFQSYNKIFYTTKLIFCDFLKKLISFLGSETVSKQEGTSSIRRKGLGQQREKEVRVKN
jgi:hypothetical protein